MKNQSKFHYILCLLVWISVLTVFYIWFFESEDGITGILLFFYDFLVTNWWGPILFIFLASIRPLVLLPAALFNLLAGVLFGFWFGLLYVILGALVSATIVYVFGKTSSRILTIQNKKIIATEKFLQHSPFMTVFTGHMFFLPFDIVNYSAGFLNIRYLKFILGMLSGSLFGIITFVGVGASLDVASIRENGVSFDVIDIKLLLWSIAFFFCVFFFSFFINNRKK